jgi:leucine dehydrogenase
MIFSAADFSDHERVLFFCDRGVGLRAIVAIHDTTLGPAVGGARMLPYANEADALTDVLRLSRGMTYKSALAGLPFGGGKAVLLGDPERDKTPELLHAFARCIDELDGRYIVGEDMNVSVYDIREMQRVTPHVAGLIEGEHAGGNPSPFTARGVHVGIRAAVRFRSKENSLAGVRVAVQGVGSVGRTLCERLHADGAELVVADIDPQATAAVAAACGARVVDSQSIHAEEVDVFAPCARGGILNDVTIPQLRAAIVAGAANNQLGEDRHGEALLQRDILYAPDYVINAGGIINGAGEILGHYDPDASLAQIDRIGETLTKVFERSDSSAEPTNRIADRMAEERLAAARASK